jgi:hypothetical protein
VSGAQRANHRALGIFRHIIAAQDIRDELLFFHAFPGDQGAVSNLGSRCPRSLRWRWCLNHLLLHSLLLHSLLLHSLLLNCLLLHSLLLNSLLLHSLLLHCLLLHCLLLRQERLLLLLLLLLCLLLCQEGRLLLCLLLRQERRLLLLLRLCGLLCRELLALRLIHSRLLLFGLSTTDALDIQHAWCNMHGDCQEGKERTKSGRNSA